MRSPLAFGVEPWCLRETGFHEELLGRSESLFALSNGHIGMRGNLDEGEPRVLPGTYLNGVYESRPLPYAETAYGNPESGQTVINVTDAKLMRLLVEDEPFDMRYGSVKHHERVLDFREGVLRRTVEWESPTGETVKVHSTRLVSLTQRAIAAIEYIVEPTTAPLRVVVQSELLANEELPTEEDDPRAAAVLERPLVPDDHRSWGTAVHMAHHTKVSNLRVVSAMDHVIEGPENTEVFTNCLGDSGQVTVAARLDVGDQLRIIKYVAYGWSARRSLPALREQVAAALTMARASGWDKLRREQCEYLDEFWRHADIEIDGDAELQQAVRFSLFHTLQASARAERRAIPAKGLSGPGYDGHAFWDMETFLLQSLIYTTPQAVTDALRWRHSILPQAKARALQLGFQGAAFPWRTIAGEECSGYWPAGTAAFHINADIADTVIRYCEAVDDPEFESTIGLELLVETARLWRSLGQHDLVGSFRIDGVTGPDEYSAIADNNVFTNLMAQRNLKAAADFCARHLDRAGELGVSVEEMASWRDAARAMYIPYDEMLNIHPQSEGFTRHEVWDFANTPPEKYPLLLHVPYLDLYRKQVIKQADLVLAIQLCPEAFTEEQKRRNFEYYETLTTRDSSLSACTQATVAAQVGHLDLAYDYLAEAAFIDLHDLAGNADDGLHMASSAGVCIAIRDGFGGMHVTKDELSFAPRLPSGITRMAFNVTVRGDQLRVDTTAKETTYIVVSDSPVEFKHHGAVVVARPREPLVLSVPEQPRLTAPQQPAGRAPHSRFDARNGDLR